MFTQPRECAIRPTLSILCLCAVLACASTGPDSVEETEPIRLGAKFELGRVTAAAGAPADVDSEALLRQALTFAIAKTGLLWTGDAAQDRYRLDTEIVRYEPGNAFKRWLVPGYGATILHVRGTLVDPKTDAPAATVDHRRSVYVGGAYTIGAWKWIFDSVAKDVAKELAQHVKGQGFFVSLEPWASREREVPAASVRGSFAIGEFSDLRPERGRIGERQAAFDVPIGEIHATRDVADWLREAVADELRAAGHTVDEPGAASEVRGEVSKLWVHTDTTPLYWDVVGEIELRLLVGPPGAKDTYTSVTHACAHTDRTWTWLTKRVVAGVLDACLADLMKSIAADPIWQSSPKSAAAPR